MKARGIVMDVQKNTVIVLTPDGRFCRLARHGQVAVGQEYAGKAPARPWIGAAAAVFMLLFLSTVYPITGQRAVAYVSVDINPSLELGVTSGLNVVSVEAVNAEAEDILTGLRLRGLPLETALHAILSAAEEKGYVAADVPSVVLAGAPGEDGDGDMEALQAALENAMVRYTGEINPSVAAAVITVTKETRHEARELGLSTGKYAVFQGAAEQGIDVTSEDLREKGIGRALQDINTHPGQILRNVDRKKQLPAPAQEKPEKESKTKENGSGRENSRNRN